MLKLNDIEVIFNPNTPSEVRALRGISLEVERGDFVTVIGANGAGKSTLFNAIAGTIAPTRGSIHLNSRDITRTPEHVRSARIGRVFQNPLLGTCPGLTVHENLALAAKRGQRRGLRPGVKRSERKRFAALLESVGMGLEARLDSDVGLLSGGQRQAITLLMATLAEPDILLLDEHTAALDPNAAAQIINLTVSLAAERHLTVIMITHSMQQAVSVGSRLVMMNRGRLVFELRDRERARITVDDLIRRFRDLANGSEFDELSDRSLLE
ncbi:MAG: ABC transporter ATP-binding protein [Phototrophicales bacterium]|nr:MAG: ABC transporter ATP-binding protein [Phototrophicales bacterium]